MKSFSARKVSLSSAARIYFCNFGASEIDFVLKQRELGDHVNMAYKRTELTEEVFLHLWVFPEALPRASSGSEAADVANYEIESLKAT